MEWILTHYTDVFAIIGQIVAVASTIVVLTPSTKDDEIVGKIVDFISRFSVFNKRSK